MGVNIVAFLWQDFLKYDNRLVNCRQERKFFLLSISISFACIILSGKMLPSDDDKQKLNRHDRSSLILITLDTSFLPRKILVYNQLLYFRESYLYKSIIEADSLFWYRIFQILCYIDFECKHFTKLFHRDNHLNYKSVHFSSNTCSTKIVF